MGEGWEEEGAGMGEGWEEEGAGMGEGREEEGAGMGEGWEEEGAGMGEGWEEGGAVVGEGLATQKGQHILVPYWWHNPSFEGRTPGRYQRGQLPMRRLLCQQCTVQGLQRHDH